MLGNLRNLFSVIGVSETWLNDTTAEQVDITGYNFVSNHRKSKSGGGVGIYLQNDLEYKLRPDCNLSDPDLTLMGKTSLWELSIDPQIETLLCI